MIDARELDAMEKQAFSRGVAAGIASDRAYYFLLGVSVGALITLVMKAL